jgi:hypothetical protein
MLAFAAGGIMEAEVEARTAAAKGARTPMREVQRNGYRDRDWVGEDQKTVRVRAKAIDPGDQLTCEAVFPRRARGTDRAGEPEAAQGQLLPELSGAPTHGRESPRGRHSGGLRHGVSTRSVDDLVKAMG